MYMNSENAITNAIARAPADWNQERVSRTLRLNPKIDGCVLIEESDLVESPQFILETK